MSQWNAKDRRPRSVTFFDSLNESTKSRKIKRACLYIHWDLPTVRQKLLGTKDRKVLYSGRSLLYIQRTCRASREVWRRMKIRRNDVVRIQWSIAISTSSIWTKDGHVLFVVPRATCTRPHAFQQEPGCSMFHLRCLFVEWSWEIMAAPRSNPQIFLGECYVLPNIRLAKD